ncbi:unnamed protein product [Rhizophagus irregularis]|nr:unnamed protein product [Rhizophagus irregularis]
MIRIISDDNSYMELDYKEMSDQSLRTAKIVAEIFGSSLNKQQIIKRFKLNHGLILTGDNIRPSKQAIISENGVLKINVYVGQPLVYTYINSEDNYDKSLDICINFPVAEMIYNGNLIESFLNYMDVDEVVAARKFLVGSRLFIKDFNLATITQIDILKFYLFYVYRLTKCSTEVQFDDLFTLNLLPKIVTSDGEELDTHEKLTRWMNNLHQKKMIDIITYDNLTPLQHNTSSIDDLEDFNEKQPGIIDFKEKLSLEEWVGDVIRNNLVSWIKDFQLFRGLIVNKNYKIVNSKNIVCNFIKIPEINLIDKVYLDIIRPITKLEQILISNNIFSIKSLSFFPFIRSTNVKDYKGFNYVLLKCEKYEILLNKEQIKPTKEFEQVIEEALNSMKPLNALQDIFNEYGHLFPQRIVLGMTLKNVVPNPSSSNTFDNAINATNEILESLDNLDISYLLTQKGKIVEKNELSNWIKNTNDNLEIIEFDNNIPLYKILDAEQQEKIDVILRNNSSIIMTGITDLKDLNNNNVEHYKRINLNTSLESEDYEVFGTIISENNSKLEELEFYVNFALYDFNGFYAIIKKSNKTNTDLTNCNVFWMIIGKPSKLSVFSPKNRRNIIVKYCKKSITLQPKQLNYHVEIPFPLLQDEFIFFNTAPKGFELRSTIKLISWNHNSIDINFDPQLNNESNSLANTEIAINIDLNICIISSYSVNLKIDNREEECPLDRIGDILIAPMISSFQELYIQDQDEPPLRKSRYSSIISRRRNMRNIRNNIRLNSTNTVNRVVRIWRIPRVPSDSFANQLFNSSPFY